MTNINLDIVEVENQTKVLSKTVLHDTHIAMGAKMVDFGGWHMPIQYTSQVEEHNAVRNHIGIFDVSHMCIVDLHGDVKPLLYKLLANNIDKLKNYNSALYTCMLNANGGVIDDLIVYYFSDNYYRLVINAGCVAKDLSWIHQVNVEFNVEVKPRKDLAMLAVQGANSLQLFSQEIQQLKPFTAHIDLEQNIVIARTGYTGEDGVEIMLPCEKAVNTWNDLIAKGAKACGLGARDTLRLESGMNLYGQDMNEETLPYNVGLGWTLSLTEDRDFIGKQALLLNQPKYQFLGLILNEGGVLRANQIVNTSNQERGEITSGGYSPTLKKSIAMARLPLSCNIGDKVIVNIRDKQLTAKVVKLPFVRKGKILVS